MQNTLQNKITENIFGAMRAKDELRLLVLRAVKAAFTEELLSLKKKPDETLDDETALAVIGREAKKRKDSIEQFEKGGRADLAENERAELAILQEFLPVLMSREEIETIAREKINSLSITDKSGQGKLIGALMSDLRGRADGADVKEVVEKLLSEN